MAFATTFTPCPTCGTATLRKLLRDEMNTYAICENGCGTFDAERSNRYMMEPEDLSHALYAMAYFNRERETIEVLEALGDFAVGMASRSQLLAVHAMVKAYDMETENL